MAASSGRRTPCGAAASSVTWARRSVARGVTRASRHRRWGGGSGRS
ncbi:hypothetical protein GGE06_006304 [Streptomyces sp. SFB5A]|uniref:Uncharacterized protein n=1 Tax=Streptomyces nymphaeiformis TaxID=2663842 RepID=A0A7W7XE28_9ACTN|nr:hypothetical protein [Streptomyces nymphaeiformis]